MACEPDQLLLRRYADAHERGERELAAELWKQLAVNNFDRVRQIVKAFRFSPGGPGLPEHEWGSAASEAYLRVIAMGAGFRNRELGQFRAALVTCVQNACRDYGRKELRHERRAAGSVDERFDPRRRGRALRLRARRLRRRAARARGRRAWRPSAAGCGPRSSSPGRSRRSSNASYREVLELTWIEKLSGEEIVARLGITPDNVYARRSRGGKEMERILRGLSA